MVNMGELFAYPRILNIPMDLVPVDEKEHHYLLQDGDLLFARQSLVLSGAGQCSIFLGNDAPTVFESHLIRCRLNPTRSNPLFYFYFFRSPDGRRAIEAIVEQGAGASGIRGSDLVNVQVPNPPKQIQDEVARLLGSLDDRITLLRETNTTLEGIAQALFKSWFVDFDPVHAKMQGRTPEGMDEATAALFPDSFEDSELGPVPKGWKTYAVGELLVPKRGKSITKSKCIDGDIPVVAGGLEPAYFHNQSNVSSPVVTISASGANAGFVRLYQQDIWASDCSFVSKEQTDSIYFWYVFLKFNQDNIYFMQQGAAQPHIYPSDLMRLNICMPKSNELSQLFHEFISPLFEKVGLTNGKIQTLSTLRDTLLPRLISGQLRVEEAAEVLA